MLYMIGVGLSNASDITLKGVEALKSCECIYLESYTSLLQDTKEKLEKLYNKKIILANRNLVEQQAETTILQQAKQKNVAFLVVGDALSATTHIDLLERAKRAGIQTRLIHNASIMTAIASTGLQLYKFGKTTSIPFPQDTYEPETPYKVLGENLSINAHTLFLLDIQPPRFMTVNEAISYLLKLELRNNKKWVTSTTVCVGVARLGSDSQFIKAGKASELMRVDFGKPPHAIIIPSKLHFAEEEFLRQFQ
jgi:diphthine methyl ester synthase